MAGTPEPPFETRPPEDLSLEALAQAYAQAMGGRGATAPLAEADEVRATAGAAREADESAAANRGGGAAVLPFDEGPATEETAAAEAEQRDDDCPLSPLTIFEAMLFVGDRGEALPPARAAEVMRGVEPGDIPALVAELNGRYAAENRPYEVVHEGAGYRLTLRPAYHALRNCFYGHVREARLSQAAIDVLAIIAYRQPVTADEVARLRGKPGSHVLAQLVRRRLLRIERSAAEGGRRVANYFTTERFLRLFNMESLDDLPRD